MGICLSVIYLFIFFFPWYFLVEWNLENGEQATDIRIFEK